MDSGARGEGPDPAGQREATAFQHVAEPRAAEARIREGSRTAVLVVHGMGQQLPFETLDSVVEGLRRAEGGAVGAGGAAGALPDAAVRLARVGGADLPRAELALRRDDGGRQDCHLYEAYWAPITEGRVTLRDVMAFLLSGAWNGRRNAREQGGFRRWMFGRPITFETPPRTAGQLLLALLVIGALVLLNVALTGSAAWLLTGHADDLGPFRAFVADLVLTVTGMLGVVLLCLGAMRWTGRMAFLYLMLAAILAGAVLVAALVVLHFLLHRSLWSIDPASGTLQLATGVVWVGLLGGSAYARALIVQYVGDVAAYVSPHRLDRFQELRQEIKDTVRKTAEAIYRARDASNAFLYDRIAVVGHSLGSVAAYDALNGLINADRLVPADGLDVPGRTCLLLTFGSPLDKTAFIFKAQGHGTGETREALAAAVQPLIQDYRFRPFPWVNVHSKQDVISGALNLYDDPDDAAQDGRRVRNIEDPAARAPLAAHVQYWKGQLVFETLRRALVGAPAA